MCGGVQMSTKSNSCGNSEIDAKLATSGIAIVKKSRRIAKGSTPATISNSEQLCQAGRCPANPIFPSPMIAPLYMQSRFQESDE